MAEEFQPELQELGLLPSEAQVYLALIRNGALGASAIAGVTGIPRSSVYPTLNSLVEKGLIEAGAGYGSRFSVVAPEQALPSLIVREKEELLHRERLAAEAVEQREHLARNLAGRLTSLAEPVEAVSEEVIQVIRSPRGVSDRFDRLQLEAERQIDGFVKAPIYGRQGNPALEKALCRGVHVRGIYERAVLEIAHIKPYVAGWVAKGEEARVYDGELPHKLIIFDQLSVLIPLTMPGDQTMMLFARHPELARSLGILFDTLWERSEPLDRETSTTARTKTVARVADPGTSDATRGPGAATPATGGESERDGAVQLPTAKHRTAKKRGRTQKRSTAGAAIIGRES